MLTAFSIFPGSDITRLREARRMHRIQRLAITLPVVPEPRRVAACSGPPQLMDKGTQSKVILHLALKAVILLQRNKLIRQKLVALHKEAYDYVEAVMSVPENRRKYLEEVRLYGTQVARENVFRAKAYESLKLD